MGKMRVCMITWYYKPRISGTANVIENMTKYLLEHGVDVCVLTRAEKNSPQEETINGVKIFRMKELAIGYDSDALYRKIRNFISKKKIDIIHAHNFHKTLPSLEFKGKDSYQQSLALFRAGKALRIPLTLSLHNYGDPELIGIEWDHYFPITRDMSRFTQDSGAEKKKTTIVYNTVDTNVFKPVNPKYRKKFNIKESEKLIFAPIPLFNKKQATDRGIFLLLEAASMLKKRFKDFKILLPGYEKLLKKEVLKLQGEIVGEARSLGIREHIIFFPGSLPDSELPYLYSSSDLVINPSIQGEPFGLQFIEGGACGKPVIGTNGGGVPEIVRDGYNGLLVQMKNSKQMSNAMYNILSDDNLAKRLGKKNKKVTYEKFSIDVQMPKVLKVYKHLLKDRGDSLC
jgi:1,4-alpha-glucan branching enzyme